ncbi:MAG: hypothetical protein ACYS3S_07855 [Planctomycetota bacterium]
MNKAQKRTWLRFAVSFTTMLIATIVISYVRRNAIDIYDMTQPTRYIILGLLSAIPLLLIVIIDWRWKEVYDERDKEIDNKAVICGAVAVFIFLAGAGWLLIVMTKMGSIKASLIILLVYLACFVWILVSSVFALVQYGREIKGDRS